MLPLQEAKVREYLDPSGRRPFAAWFDDLTASAAAKVTTAVTRLGQGNFSNVKGVGSGVFEYRLDFGPGDRVYFAGTAGFSSSCSGGGSKRRQKRDIDAATQGGRITSNDAGEGAMTLTRDFKETVQARVQRDPAFRKELLREGLQCMLQGDVETGKIVLRDYINATVGFNELGEVTHRSPKSLMRMFGPQGNPQARNLFAIVAYLLKREGARFTLRVA